MPNGDQGLGGPPIDPTISITVSEMAGPSAPTDVPWSEVEDYVRETRQVLERDWGMSPWFAHFAAAIMGGFSGLVIVVAHLAILLIKPFLPAFGGAVFAVIDDIRKTLDPQFAQFSVAVLNELLGTEFTVNHFPQDENIDAHLERAQEIGFLFHKQLMREFLGATGITLDAAEGTFSEPTGPAGAGEKITPMSGVRAAARFSGLAINFGTATGIIGTIGGLVPEVHLNELREIGELVAKNLGLGRLQRLALAPIVQILLAEPYKWFINELARPTQLGLGEVVNPFTGAVMPAELIWRDLARAGYSDDKITALLELHRKKLGEGDVLTLFEGGHLDESQVFDYYKRLGYSDEDARAKKEADLLKANRPYVDELRSAIVTAYADGHIDRQELVGLVDGLPLRQEERDYIKLAAEYKRKVPSKHLTFAELQQAFSEGIIDVTEFDAHLASFGYSDDDQSILLLLTLTKMALAKEKAAAAAARTQAKATKKPSTPAPPAPPVPPPAG